MQVVRDIRALRRYILFGYAASTLLLIFGVISLLLFTAPEIVWVPQDQQGAYRSNVVWLLAGLYFVVFAIICILVSRRWSNHLVWIVRNIEPVKMKARIQVDEDSDSTSYYAIVNQNGVDRSWRVDLYHPSWDVKRVVGEELTVDVYLEPSSNTPAVLETEFGLLWRMAGNGSVQELSLQ
jgi:hypothetical protein